MIDMRLHSGRFVSLGKEDSPSVTLYSKKKKTLPNLQICLHAAKWDLGEMQAIAGLGLNNGASGQGGGEPGTLLGLHVPGVAGGAGARGGRHGDPRRELASAARCKTARRLARLLPHPQPPAERGWLRRGGMAWAGGCGRAGPTGGGGGAGAHFSHAGVGRGCLWRGEGGGLQGRRSPHVVAPPVSPAPSDAPPGCAPVPAFLCKATGTALRKKHVQPLAPS